MRNLSKGIYVGAKLCKFETVEVVPKEALQVFKREFFHEKRLPGDLTIRQGVAGTWEDDHRGGEDFRPYHKEISPELRKILEAFITLEEAFNG